MTNITAPLIRYPFENIANFRDIGGYAAQHDTVLRWGVFFRSARLTHATPAEIAAIKQLGVRTILDLRNKEEIQSRPDACMQDPDLGWQSLSLLEGIDLSATDVIPDPDSVPPMSTLYIWMIDNCQKGFHRLFTLLAESVQKGAVLFHCMAGKDRTGLTAMFLQAICGVDRMDIVAHYQISHTYNLRFLPEDTSGSSPEHMIALLNHLDAAHGGPVAYLRHIGIPEEAMNTLRSCMLVPRQA